MNYKENRGKKSFSCKTKESISCIPIRKKCLWCLIMRRMKIITRIHVYLFQRMNIDSRQIDDSKAILAKEKNQYRASLIGERVYDLLSWKECRLFQESNFVFFSGWTLILRKIKERKAFLAKPKYQYCVSQWGEHNYCIYPQKEWR